MSAKRIVITGAASGIGAATMAELQRRGCRVVGLDLNGARPDLIRCDVRDQRRSMRPWPTPGRGSVVSTS